MNAESSRARSTGTTSRDMRAIWPGALLVVYLAATGALLLARRDHAPGAGIALHFAVLAAIAAATWFSMVPRWLRAWTPLLALLFLYSEMPMLIEAAGHDRLFDERIISWEQSVFGGQPAIAWAAAHSSVWLSELLHAAYLTYYPIIVSVPAALWLARRRAEFDDAVFVLMLTFVACFVCYLAFPVAGPRYLWPPSSPPGPFRSAAIALLEARSSRGTAFPSSHVAVAITQSLLAFRFYGLRGVVVAAPTAGLALGAVYGGFHYAIDIVAGGLLGVFTTMVGLAARVRARDPRQAKASAPTYPASPGPEASPSSN